MNNLDPILQEKLTEPLSNVDIKKKLHGHVNIIKYESLVNYDNIDDILGEWGCCVILYELRNNSGHWVCLFKTKDNKISFFDPYALKPDDQLNFINVKFRLENNSYYPYLTYLLYKSPYPIEYNEYQLQDFNNKSLATCGRWCCCRLMFRDMSVKQFYNHFKSFNDITSDEFVTLIYDLF
jgi:hypothetical protein